MVDSGATWLVGLLYIDKDLHEAALLTSVPLLISFAVDLDELHRSLADSPSCHIDAPLQKVAKP